MVAISQATTEINRSPRSDRVKNDSSLSVHKEVAFSVTINEAFRKRSPECIFLKSPISAIFMMSRWLDENGAFENADVSASIYEESEHAHGYLGITQGHFDCLLSFVKVRTVEFECSSALRFVLIKSNAKKYFTSVDERYK